jgi:hypothetical protein
MTTSAKIGQAFVKQYFQTLLGGEQREGERERGRERERERERKRER